MKQDSLIRLIVIEESANDAEVILNSLRKARLPIRPTHVEDAEDLQKALNSQEWDLIISVPQVGELETGQICELVATSKQDIPVVVLCAELTAGNMAKMFSEGVRQVIPAGNETCLQISVRRELEDLDERRQRRRSEYMYRETQRHNLMLLETSRDAISYVHDGMHVHANPTYLQMFGYKGMDELEGMPVMNLVAPENHPQFKEFMREYMTGNKEDRDIELIGVRGGNKKFKLKMEVSQAIYENERCVQIIIRDQTDSKELEKKLKEISRLDQLTGLYNRQYFIQILEKAISKAMEQHTRSVLLYVGLDNYAKARENVGIAGADQVIANIANVIKKAAPEAHSSRLDESVYTILLIDKDVAVASQLAEQLRKLIEATVNEAAGKSVVLTASIGITPVLAASAKPENVLSDAHQAYEEAVKKGGNCVEVYKAVIKSDGQANIDEVKKMIETAIEEKRLHLAYQPVVSLRGESEQMYDVFLRMTDAKGERVPAATLFKAADQAGYISKLERWVLKEAVKVLAQRRQAGHRTLLFVRLSLPSIADEGTLLYINKLLAAAKLPGDQLIIEISESVVIDKLTLVKAFINNLKKMRCKSALEHFGTGLNWKITLETHLSKDYIDFVKIDSSYAKGLSTNVENQNSVKEMVKLAHSLGKHIIAEAVEDANSLTVLFQCDADYAQGHYLQEPIEEMEYDFSAE